MIGFISSWAQQIIIAVIVITILEMILPKGNSKKYIKTIMGVYILYTIISPAIKLVTGADMKIDYSDYKEYFGDMEVTGEVEGITVEDTYKSQIEKQMKLDIEKMGYMVSNISFELDTENWIIKSVNLSVLPNNRRKKYKR